MSDERATGPVRRSSDTDAIGHLCVVAGARAAGKSTFIRQLKRSQIPGELAGLLPDGIGHWQRLNASALRGDDDEAPREQIATPGPGRREGLILHYDLIRFSNVGLDDSALAWVASARALTVVTICPPVDRLLVQLRERNRERIVGLLQTGKNDRRTPRGNFLKRTARIASLYQTDGWIDRLYADWKQGFLEMAGATPLRWLEIEPEPQADSGVGWRVRHLEDFRPTP